MKLLLNDGTKVEESYFSNNKLFLIRKEKDGREIEYREYNTDGSLSAKRP